MEGGEEVMGLFVVDVIVLFCGRADGVRRQGLGGCWIAALSLSSLAPDKPWENPDLVVVAVAVQPSNQDYKIT
jgi:hypothetical protein